MAQRTEKEETEFKVVPADSTPTTPTIILCVNNCGLVASPKTNNMCQDCFNSITSSSSAASTAVATSQKQPRSISSRSPTRSPVPPEGARIPTVQDPAAEGSKREVSRCSGCRRKVGLTGFRCRCGDLFCADHRYSDRHDCSYDYKAAGREAIARENPVVKAAKIVRV